jgi:hypothetical protein
MENKFFKLNPTTSDWSNYTFIFTSVSVGNIGQLATDLLISTIPKTFKTGFLISDLVQPVIGYNAFASKSIDLSTSCERNNNNNK